jgi:hypothetical protein
MMYIEVYTGGRTHGSPENGLFWPQMICEDTRSAKLGTRSKRGEAAGRADVLRASRAVLGQDRVSRTPSRDGLFHRFHEFWTVINWRGREPLTSPCTGLRDFRLPFIGRKYASSESRSCNRARSVRDFTVAKDR